MTTAEGQLQDELLSTWEEYYQLLIEIVSRLSPDVPQLRTDLLVTDLIDIHNVAVSRSAITSPHRTR